MGLLRTIGTALNYLGILVMLVGLISLVLGIQAVFTGVSSQMQQAYAQAGQSPAGQTAAAARSAPEWVLSHLCNRASFIWATVAPAERPNSI